MLTIWLSLVALGLNRVALKDIGGIGPLMELLSCGHQELRSPAAKVLATLADTAEVRGQLLLSGAVQPVVQLLREAPAGGPSSRIAALALCNLSAGLDENLPGSESMLDAPVLSALVDVRRPPPLRSEARRLSHKWLRQVLAGCPDPETLMWCCKAASRMARASENARRCLCKSGCVEALLRLLMLLGSWAAREQVKHSNRGAQAALVVQVPVSTA